MQVVRVGASPLLSSGLAVLAVTIRAVRAGCLVGLRRFFQYRLVKHACISTIRYSLDKKVPVATGESQKGLARAV